MRLAEVESTAAAAGADVQKLAAISQFLLSRAEDTSAEKTISLDAFLSLANSQGIPLTKDSLILLSQQPPLSNMIKSVESDKVVFKGAKEEQVTDTMSVDKARQTVDKMAKRSASKKCL